MRISFRDNHFRARKLRPNSGQAVIEYIMILVVSIALILGAVYQMNSAFKVWAKSYFGDYVSCLLETGELPALGGTGGASTGCNAIFKPFSLADGRPAIGEPIGSGNDSSGKDKSDKSGAADSSGANSNYTKVSAPGSSRFGSDSFGAGRTGAGGDGAGSAAKKPRNVYTGSTEDSLSGALGGQSRNSASSRTRFINYGGYSTSGPQEEERKERILAKVSEGTRMIKNERILVKAKPPKPVVLEPDEPMTFGDYFRYLLIAAIIIALVIVIGGQLSQMSKSMD